MAVPHPSLPLVQRPATLCPPTTARSVGTTRKAQAEPRPGPLGTPNPQPPSPLTPWKAGRILSRFSRGRLRADTRAICSQPPPFPGEWRGWHQESEPLLPSAVPLLPCGVTPVPCGAADPGPWMRRGAGRLGTCVDCLQLAIVFGGAGGAHAAQRRRLRPAWQQTPKGGTHSGAEGGGGGGAQRCMPLPGRHTPYHA